MVRRGTADPVPMRHGTDTTGSSAAQGNCSVACSPGSTELIPTKKQQVGLNMFFSGIEYTEKD